jgi:hypothetical protein
MLLYSLLPFYKKERINYNSEIEQNKIAYKRLLSELKDKRKITLERNTDRKKKKEIKQFFSKQLRDLKSRHKESKLQAKINLMAAVSKNKELKENVKLIKKSKSNLHRVLYYFAKLPYDEKKNSLVVQELSPSREANFSIKKRVFHDLTAFADNKDDRVYASEKDILFTTIQFGTGVEKIPIVLRYAGQCVPVFLDKIRDDTYDKFSTENEHHIMLYSARIRETKAPKQGLKIGKFGFMAIIIGVLMLGYMAYKYSNGGF